MRRFWIVFSSLVALLLVGSAGYLIGNGQFFNHDPITARVNEQGQLEITSHSSQPIELDRVEFNDRAPWRCSAAPFLRFYWPTTATYNPYLATWTPNWGGGPNAVLFEGDYANAFFNRGKDKCGAKIVKAVVYTSAGVYSFDFRPHHRDWHF